MTVVKEKLGAKQTCPSCGAKFYDLGRLPAVCPKCEHSFEPQQIMPRSRSGRQAANGAAAAEAKAKTATDDSEVKKEKAEPVVTFEEADEETAGAKRSGAPSLDDDADIEIDNDVEVENDNDDGAGLLDEEDDYDDDVAGIIDADMDKDD